MPYIALTGREHQIAKMIASGLSNKQIAAGLSIAIGTVRIHLANIYRKTGVANRTQLAVRYIAYAEDHIEHEEGCSA